MFPRGQPDGMDEHHLCALPREGQQEFDNLIKCQQDYLKALTGFPNIGDQLTHWFYTTQKPAFMPMHKYMCCQVQLFSYLKKGLLCATMELTTKQHLDYSLVESTRETWITFTQCWCYYATHNTAQQLIIQHDFMNLLFANCSEDDSIYPLMVKEIAEAQQADHNIQQLASDQKYTIQLVENKQVLSKGTAMVLPTTFRH